MSKLKLGMVGQHSTSVLKGEPLIIKEDPKIMIVKGVYEKTRENMFGLSDYYKLYAVCAIVNVTKDFNPYSDELILIEYDTSSFQIRPKLIYKDKKGYYYKPYGKVVRLTELEMKEVDDFINKNKNDN